MMELESCLKFLKAASSDSEKIAGLVVVAKLVKSNELDHNERRRVFETIGFTFLDRLLSTNQVPDGGTENPYHQIAVTILACFCTDQELALHPKLTSKVPLFNDFIQAKDPKASVLAQDSLQCLRSLSSSSIGTQYLLKFQSLPALARAYLAQNDIAEESKEILLSVLGNLSTEESQLHQRAILDVLTILAQEFCKNQEQLKFELCRTLNLVISITGNLLKEASSRPPDQLKEGDNCMWMKELAAGLTDIFSSRLDSERRELALELSGVLAQVFGIEWAVERHHQFFLLWLRLAVVEVRLAVEGKELEAIAEKSPLLCSCFSMLEAATVYVSRHSEEDPTTQTKSQVEILLQLHTILTEALNSVLHLLTAVSRSGRFRQERTLSLKSLGVFLTDYPIVTASVRVLGAWLAEDSLTLAAEVYCLLPFLVELCWSSTPQEEDADLLKFLLPGLCHLTADDKARPVLIRAKFIKMLSSYMESLLAISTSSSEHQDRLVLCCGVCMNVCVASPGDVKEDADGSFSSLASLGLRIISRRFGEESDVMVMNAITLFLMICRRKDSLVDGAFEELVWCSLLDQLLALVRQHCPYLPSSGHCHNRLSCGHTPRDVAAKWEVVSQLWSIAIQELNCLISRHQVIRAAAAKCSFLPRLSEIMSSLMELDQQADVELVTSPVHTLLQKSRDLR